MDTMMLVVVGIALALAVGMAAVAWRLLRGDRERTEARAAMLRQLAFEPEPELEDRVFQSPSVPSSFEPAFGATFERTPPPSRRLMAVGVVIVFMAVGAGSVYGIYKPVNDGDAGGSRDSGLSRRSSAGAKAGEVPPLELLSLSHRREAEDFVVAGLVQNPQDGSSSSVMAVVYVFNAQGEYFASGKAALEFGQLAPGAESPFVVRLPKTAGVSRFRVGFRTEDGAVVAHVDRRGRPMGGTMPGGNLPQSGGL